LWREENWKTQRKTLRARRKPTTNSTLRSHWWEVSAITITPFLLLELEVKCYKLLFIDNSIYM